MSSVKTDAMIISNTILAMENVRRLYIYCFIILKTSALDKWFRINMKKKSIGKQLQIDHFNLNMYQIKQSCFKLKDCLYESRHLYKTPFRESQTQASINSTYTNNLGVSNHSITLWNCIAYK